MVVLQVYLISCFGDNENETLDSRCRKLALECLAKLKSMIDLVSPHMLVRTLRMFCEVDDARYDRKLEATMAQALSSMRGIDIFMRSQPYTELLAAGRRYSEPLLKLLSKALVAGSASRCSVQDVDNDRW